MLMKIRASVQVSSQIYFIQNVVSENKLVIYLCKRTMNNYRYCLGIYLVTIGLLTLDSDWSEGQITCVHSNMLTFLS